MDKNQNREVLSDYINDLQFGGSLSKLIYRKAKKLYEMGHCHLMIAATNEYQYEVNDEHDDFDVKLNFEDKTLHTKCSCGSMQICAHVFASLQQTQEELNRSFLHQNTNGLQYSREGMIKRVLEERKQRALQEDYQIQFADNIHGEHLLTSGQDKVYKLSFYDFEKKQGYCSCPDYQTNKLETCKHLMYAFHEFENLAEPKPNSSQSYPFLEIFRHPLSEYQISWFYPHQPGEELLMFLSEFFDEKQIWKTEKWPDVHLFLEKAKKYRLIKIRPEVERLIAEYYESESLKETYQEVSSEDAVFPKQFFPYQKKGAGFIAARKGCFLADEIGMGKSAQALVAGLLKIKFSGFQKVNIVCPIELVSHWHGEVNKWVAENQRTHFAIWPMNRVSQSGDCDFLIIDEAQRIEDYESGLLRELVKLKYQHILLITDSKFENSLMKFHAMAPLIEQHLLTPLWELSYKHCLFDPNNKGKVIQYHHLDLIGKRLENYYLRRERIEVLEQLPPAKLIEIPVALSLSLLSEQSDLAKVVLDYCNKKKLNNYDLVQLKSSLKSLYELSMHHFSSKYSAAISPKMNEMMHFIMHKLNLSEGQKVMIFANGKSLQNQIIRGLQDERKKVVLYNPDHPASSDVQYFISEENSEIDVSFAHHFVYYHLPANPADLWSRMQATNNLGQGIQQHLFYLLLSVDSMESLIFNWQQQKVHFSKQLVDFIYQLNNQNTISLRLLENLAYEVSDFVQKEEVNELKEVQMNLFGEPIGNRNIEQPLSVPKQDNEIHKYFQSFLHSWSLFDQLTDAQKKIISRGNIKVDESKDEILIRIAKK